MTNSKRQSICSACGKRLSTRDPGGDILWQPSHVNDIGILCDACYLAKEKDKPKKNTRTKPQE